MFTQVLNADQVMSLIYIDFCKYLWYPGPIAGLGFTLVHFNQAIHIFAWTNCVSHNAQSCQSSYSNFCGITECEDGNGTQECEDIGSVPFYELGNISWVKTCSNQQHWGSQ